MGKGHRPRMLAQEIQRIVSSMLLRGELKDPAFRNMIVITGVDLTNDGSYATLYVTSSSYDPKWALTDDEKKAVITAFDKAKGFIRGEIGKQIKLRHVPELIFKQDTSYEYGMKMDALLDSLDIKPAEPGEVPSEEKDEFAEEFD